MKRRGVYLYCAHAAPGDADPVWEAACLRWWWSACSVLSGPSPSGASPLPQGYAVCVMSWRAGNPGRGRTGFGPCRSDDAGPVWEVVCLRWWWSACSVLSGPSLSGASPLPQGYVVCIMSWRAGNSGRGRTGSGYVDQTTQVQCGRWSACSVLSGPSLSGASPLPQGYAVCVMSWRAGNPGRGRTGFGPCRSDDADPVWEGACPRWRRVSRHHN